jgi:superfamily II DNA/RNA helicase
MSQRRKWQDLGLHPAIIAQCALFLWDFPSRIQSDTIPAILEGKDIIGSAKTGSGKTAAFALPILQKLAEEPFGIFALILTPTRSVLR